MKLNNTYYILRHGEARSNVESFNSSWPEIIDNPITENGREQVKKAIEKLKDDNIDLIFSSDLLRTKQTAEMLGETFGLKPIYDERLREIDFGSLNGKPIEELLYISFTKGEKKEEGSDAETYKDVHKRVKSFLGEVNKKYKGKTIVIVSHQCPLWVLEGMANGHSLEHSATLPRNKRIKRGELRKLN